MTRLTDAEREEFADNLRWHALAQTLRGLSENRPLLALAAQNHLIAQRDYMGQDLGSLVNPWAETLRTLADALCPTPPGGCPTPGCDGDARYAAPGRRHIEGCTYPTPPASSAQPDEGAS